MYLYRNEEALPDCLIMADDDSYINIERITEYLTKNHIVSEDQGLKDHDRYVPLPTERAILQGVELERQRALSNLLCPLEVLVLFSAKDLSNSGCNQSFVTRKSRWQRNFSRSCVKSICTIRTKNVHTHSCVQASDREHIQKIQTFLTNHHAMKTLSRNGNSHADANDGSVKGTNRTDNYSKSIKELNGAQMKRQIASLTNNAAVGYSANAANMISQYSSAILSAMSHAKSNQCLTVEDI